MKGKFIRGVVEGFYGKPWSWNERKNIISLMGSRKYNLYIYAPKEDEFHRDLWRENYPANFMEEFGKLTVHGEKENVEVSIALSPGLSLIHSDSNELETLFKKFLSFAELGVRTFCLFLDDIPEELQHEEDKACFESLADAQQFFTNSLYKMMKSKIEDFKLILCPTFYFGKTVNEYHVTLGKNVHPDIEIMWTGPEVCSEIISTEDAKMVSKAYNRPVLYWDNYPVNDSSMVPELHIGPYSGRDKDLYKYSSGIILNPMNQAYASMIVLENAADYFEEKEDFDLIKSWESSLTKYSKGCEKSFLHFANANLESPLHKSTPEISKEIVGKFKTLYFGKKRKEASEYLIETGNLIKSNYIEIKNNISSDLLADITPWIDEYLHWGKVIEKTGEMVLADLEMYRENPSEENLCKVKKANSELENLLRDAFKFETNVFGNEILDFSLNRLKISKGLLKMYIY